jgi:cyclopropane fatty-acyl-phospholipid synthase-like methyltransferase
MAATGPVTINRDYYDGSYYKGHLSRLAKNDRFTKVKIRRLLSLLLPQKNELILDLGSGVGTIMIALAQTGATPLGLDYSWKSLVLARENFSTHGAGSPFRGICCDGRSICLKENSLDGIAAVDFTEHLDDAFLTPTLSEAHRILKKGGRLALYTPSVTHVFEKLKKHNVLLKEDISHIGLRRMQDYLMMLRKTGFSISESYFEPTHIPLFSLLEMLVMHVPLIGGLAKRRICICAVK